MKKISLAFLILLVTAAIAVVLWTATSERKKSDDIMSKFKEVEKSLEESQDTAHEVNGLGAVQKIYPIASLKSATVFLIDSLKEKYSNISRSAKQGEASKLLRPDVRRLLSNMQELNQLKKDVENINTTDTVKYWSASEKFSEDLWYKMFFESTSAPGVITYLNYLRNQVVAIN
jgi:hypothetical protein